MLTAASLFDLSDFTHRTVFRQDDYVWTALDQLKPYMDRHHYPAIDRTLIADGRPLTEPVVLYDGSVYAGATCDITYGDTTKGGLVVKKNGELLPGASVIMAGAVLMGDRIDLGKGVLIETGSLIKSPAILGDHCEVRQGAYLRGYCLAGKRCVLGHATEVKHSIFLNDAKAGHFAYLGDSILGTNSNLGAGTKFANLRFIKGNVTVQHNGARIDTGRRKFGAILGDNCQTGCNSVTSPGTVFGQGCMLMPNATSPSGFHPKNSLIRDQHT